MLFFVSQSRGEDVTELGEVAETFAIGNLSTLDNHGGGNDKLDATFGMVIDFEAKTEGDTEMIFETGGRTTGHTFLYEASNTLLLLWRNGDATMAVRYTLPAGPSRSIGRNKVSRNSSHIEP